MAENGTQNNHDQQASSTWQNTLILVVIGLILVITAVTFYPDARQKLELSITETAPSLSPTPEDTPAAPNLTPFPVSEEYTPPTPQVYAQVSEFGSLALSIREGSDIHLFLYRPFLENTSGDGLSALPLTRITSGAQQDITPAVSPDGSRIAFASNRDGPWDIYILDLASGETSRFTDTRAYDANPTWSPDGQWLAYESYQIDNLEIIIQDIDRSSGPIPLTNHSAADYAPSWSGQGRKISYISTRSGKQEVWYADLDSTQADKALQVPGTESYSVGHPCWSADGRYLAWSVISPDGDHSLVIWDSSQPESHPRFAGEGDWPVWGGGPGMLYAIISKPPADYLTAYPAAGGAPEVMLPAVELPGRVEGISWTETITLNSTLLAAQDPAPTPIWDLAAQETGDATSPEKLLELRNLDAPFPQFVESAVSSYYPLRERIRELSGWDFLDTLESAYQPLGAPLEPGADLTWLYTGRAVLTNDIPRLAGWLVVTREEYGDKTYWRIYLRANDQSGLLGQPLKAYPWDFDTRYSRNNAAYENGGSLSPIIPPGYWIDFTAVAEAYGWFRFPAETYWQYSETASRYQLFAFKQGLSLNAALLQLYAPAAIQDLIGSSPP